MMIAPGLLEGVIGGSFTTSPVRLLDQEYAGTGSTALDIDFRFLDSATSNKLQIKQVDNSIVDVADTPQWKTDSLSTPTYSARYTAIDVSSTGTLAFGTPAINTWTTITSSNARFAMERPGSGMVFMIYTIEVADNADLTTILARANLTLRYTRA